MKLEQEIKQKKFASEQEKLHINMVFTGNWLNTKAARYFKQFDITAQQYNVLRILRGQHPKAISVGDVQSRMLDKSSNITRLVDKLLEKEFVTRSENKESRRMMDLAITEKGLKFLETIKMEDTDFHICLKKVSAKDAKICNDILDRIRD